MGSIRRGQVVSTHGTEPVPSGSKVDTSEPVSHAGGTYVTTELKKGEKCCLCSQPSWGGREKAREHEAWCHLAASQGHTTTVSDL